MAEPRRPHDEIHAGGRGKGTACLGGKAQARHWLKRLEAADSNWQLAISQTKKNRNRPKNKRKSQDSFIAEDADFAFRSPGHPITAIAGSIWLLPLFLRGLDFGSCFLPIRSCLPYSFPLLPLFLRVSKVLLCSWFWFSPV